MSLALPHWNAQLGLPTDCGHGEGEKKSTVLFVWFWVGVLVVVLTRGLTV